MKDNTLSKLGGTCSILLGISYVVVGITYVLMPAAQRTGTVEQLFVSVTQNPTMLLLSYWAYALGGALALGAVPAISATVRSGNEGWVRWTSNLAIVGFAVTAIGNFRLQFLMPIRAAAYVAGDAVTKTAIANNQGLLYFDRQGWLIFGAVGLWILVVSVLALRGGAWPKPLGYIGIAVAIAYWFAVAGNVLQIGTLNMIAAVAAIILGPILFIWLGLRLRQAG
jgi:hypothetical protein